MAFIEVKNLSFSYSLDENRSLQVLRDVSFTAEKGEYIAVLGHNGSGKSTLARLITMIEDYDRMDGKIIIDGVDLTDSDLTDGQINEQRRRVGMVFQNPDNQLVATIVEEDVAFGPENLGIERLEIRRRVDWALETVGMTEYARHEPHRLSGGQKQRVAIAGVIAMMPECIIFDESTAMLDPSGRHEVLATMEMLNKEKNITVFNITHYMDEAARADRIIVLNDGKIWLDGTPDDVFSQGDKLLTAGLELPVGAALAKSLTNNGFEISGSVSTVENAANSIEKSYKEKRKTVNGKNKT